MPKLGDGTIEVLSCDSKELESHLEPGFNRGAAAYILWIPEMSPNYVYALPGFLADASRGTSHRHILWSLLQPAVNTLFPS
jgi:hypothetical protein